MGAGGKLVLASKAKKALNKPAKLAHKTLLNKAPRYVPAYNRAVPGCVCVIHFENKRMVLGAGSRGLYYIPIPTTHIKIPPIQNTARRPSRSRR